jgi:hypothetical protein
VLGKSSDRWEKAKCTELRVEGGGFLPLEKGRGEERGGRVDVVGWLLYLGGLLSNEFRRVPIQDFFLLVQWYVYIRDMPVRSHKRTIQT